MNKATRLALFSVLLLGAGGALMLRLSGQAPRGQQPPEQATSADVTVTLCDGKTEVPVPGLKPGEKLSRPEAQQLANLFMARWRQANPEQAKAGARGSQAPAAAKQSEIYSRFSARDEFVWKTELAKFVQEGNRIFHDAEAFGGTVGVSCDMCHPDAANTHPETYPKYQVQLQRVALLRDMINWCIQHPTKGKPLADDDPRLRAMEAYIIAQRAGKAIEPGKH